MPANRFEIWGLPYLRSSQIVIIQAAKTGERDPARLYEQALKTFSIDDMSMLVVSVGSDLPVPAYASVTQAA